MRNALSFFRSRIWQRQSSIVYLMLFVISFSFLTEMKTVDAKKFALDDGEAVEVKNIQTDKEKVFKKTTNEKKGNSVFQEMSLKLSAKICEDPEIQKLKLNEVVQEKQNVGSDNDETTTSENENDGSVQAIAGPQNMLKINDIINEEAVSVMGANVIKPNQIQYTVIDDIENAVVVAKVKEEVRKETERALAEQRLEQQRLRVIEEKQRIKEAKAAKKKRKMELVAKKKAEKARAKADALVKEQRATKKAYGFYLSEKEKDILLRIVEAEATGEDLEGRMLVANVIINRMKSNEFPDKVSDVVFQKTGASYQFSPIGDGRYWSVSISDKTQRAVRRVLLGEDNSKGALYFMARKYSSPRNVVWFDNSLTWLFQHGVHEFYK